MQPICSTRTSTFALVSAMVLGLGGATQGQVFDNPAAISIPTFGTASPFPSQITVSGANQVLTSITIDLLDYSHTASYDLQIAVQSPSGTSVLLMGQNSGDQFDLNLNLTFDDAAADSLPEFASLQSQSYRPTTHGADLSFTSPGPAQSSWSTSLSDFLGEDPNGVWKLFVEDYVDEDGGTIAGGWAINITAAVPEPSTYAGLAGLGLAAFAAIRRLRARLSAPQTPPAP